MGSSIFFKKKNIKFYDLFPKEKHKFNFKVNDIKSLDLAKKNEITFFDSVKYRNLASQTKASACITTKKLKQYLPNNTSKIIVKNVLFELARTAKALYPDSDIDYPDLQLKKPHHQHPTIMFLPQKKKNKTHPSL